MAGSIGSTNGIGTNSRFNNLHGVAISPDGVYALVADRVNHLIRHLIISTANVTTFAGVALSAGSTNGIGTNSRFNHPEEVSISPDGVYALVGDIFNHQIRHIIISTANVRILAGMGSIGSANGVGTNSRFNLPHGVSISPDGVYALVIDSNNHQIRHIIISTAHVTTLAGLAGSSGSTNGIGTNARFRNPGRVMISPDGVYALAADSIHHLIRQIVISTASVRTLAGVTGSAGSANGIGTNSRFNGPTGVSISPCGRYALVANGINHMIRQVFITRLTDSPTLIPSSAPSVAPTFDLSISYFSFGVRDASKAILVDYLEDDRTGNIQPLTS